MSVDSGCPPPFNARARCVLDAARTCFERYGFHAASMARIAEEADISVGHIYRYFANKEAVVAAIVRQDLDEISQDLERLNGSPEELADHILDTFESSRSRAKTILRLEVLAEGARNPKVAAMVAQMELGIRERVGAAIAMAREKQGSAPLKPAEMALRVSLIGILIEGLQIRAFHEGEHLTAELSRQMRSLLVQTFSSAPITTDAADILSLYAEASSRGA